MSQHSLNTAGDGVANDECRPSSLGTTDESGAFLLRLVSPEPRLTTRAPALLEESPEAPARIVLDVLRREIRERKGTLHGDGVHALLTIVVDECTSMMKALEERDRAKRGEAALSRVFESRARSLGAKAEITDPSLRDDDVGTELDILDINAASDAAPESEPEEPQTTVYKPGSEDYNLLADAVESFNASHSKNTAEPEEEVKKPSPPELPKIDVPPEFKSMIWELLVLAKEQNMSIADAQTAISKFIEETVYAKENWKVKDPKVVIEHTVAAFRALFEDEKI